MTKWYLIYHIYIYMCVCVYTHTHTHTHTCIYWKDYCLSPFLQIQYLPWILIPEALSRCLPHHTQLHMLGGFQSISQGHWLISSRKPWKAISTTTYLPKLIPNICASVHTVPLTPKQNFHFFHCLFVLHEALIFHLSKTPEHFIAHCTVT